MNKVTFITGNPHKADFLAKHLDYAIEHKKLELEEIQSLDLHKVAENKAKQAYMQLHSPVLVEDVGLVFDGMGRLPGPLIKWFEEELGQTGICRFVDGLSSRRATAAVTYAYFDGKDTRFFDGELKGQISMEPSKDDGFGWNCLFIPNGANKTLSEMDEEETKKFSLRTTTVYPQIKEFLQALIINKPDRARLPE